MRKVLLRLMAIGIVAGVLFAMFGSQHFKSNQPSTIADSPNRIETKHPPTNRTRVKENSPTDFHKEIQDQVPQITTNQFNDHDLSEEIRIKPEQEALEASLRQVQEAYRYQNRFAKGTTELTLADHHLLKPNQAFDVQFPVGEDQTTTATLKLNQYYFLPGDVLNAQVDFSAPIQLDSLKVVLLHEGISLKEWPHPPQKTEMFKFSWTLPKTLPTDWEGNKQLMITFKDSAGFNSSLIAGIKLSPLTSEVLSIKDVSQNSQFIRLGVEVEVSKKGRYRIKGNIFDQKSPIAHLNQKYTIDSIGKHTLWLQLDAAALSEKEIEQPLYLDNIQIEQLPLLPGDSTFYGRSRVTKYNLPPLDPSLFPKKTSSEQTSEFLDHLAD